MYKVLIVEDEKIIRKGLIYTFDWSSHNCTIIGEAVNGAEGLEKIYELEPDIVIADVTMPRMDGLTMLEKTINECIYTAIILSGFDEFPLAKKAIKMGVAEYLIKPVDHNQLSEAIEHAKVQLSQKQVYSQLKNIKTVPAIQKVLEEYSETITSQKVKAMVDYIRNHYNERISITDLSEELDTSPTHLRSLFKSQTTYTFNEFLNRYRIQQSIYKIQHEGGKIYNIASEVGFSDYHYFINVFKKYTNYSPGKFVQLFYKENQRKGAEVQSEGSII